MKTIDDSEISLEYTSINISNAYMASIYYEYIFIASERGLYLFNSDVKKLNFLNIDNKNDILIINKNIVATTTGVYEITISDKIYKKI